MKVLQEIKVPFESVNDSFLNVVEVPFINGDKVNKDEIVLELETSKTVISLETEYDGFIEYLCDLAQAVAINSVVVKIWDEKLDLDKSVIAKTIEEDSSSAKNMNFNGEFKTIFSLKAVQLINDYKLSADNFKHLDFANSAAVNSYLNLNQLSGNEENSSSTKINKRNIEEPPLDLKKTTLKKLNYAKKREIEYLSDVQSSGLVSLVNIELDIEYVFDSVNDSLKYFKNSVLPILVYECSRLLVKYPIFNSYYTDQGIALYNNVNIGIAMDIDDGLKVVKLADTNKMNLNVLEENLFELANKYLDKKLNSEDLTDVTFTISDLSSFGALSFSPLINKNNSSILGISKIDEKLNRIILSMAFDHRVTEGKMASIFLQDLKGRFESYASNVKKEKLSKSVRCYKCLKSIDEDLNDIGFIKVFNKKGEDRYLCDMCLLNF